MAKRGRKPGKAKQLGLEGVAEGPDRMLDEVTSKLSSIREEKNELIETEKLQVARALDRMLKTGRSSYKKNGVELLLSHTDRLRVRLVKDSEKSAEPEA